MATLFNGDPQSATSYSASSTETPKWMQDAIYNQVNWSQNIANRPFESYSLPTVAELSPMQQQAYTGISNAQGDYQTNFDQAQTGIAAMAGIPPIPATNTSAASNQAATSQIRNDGLLTVMGQDGNTNQNLFGQNGNLSMSGTGQGSMGNTTGSVVAPTPQAGGALYAANPYLQQAGDTSVSNVNTYMNPYQTNVMDALAQQGTRNLTENLLPGVSDSFIKAGQFGSRNMGEFGSRALRDTQESILRQQAPLMQQGYAQAMQASAGDKARQAGLAGTVGGISTSDLGRQFSALQSMGDMAIADQNANYRDLTALEAAGQAEQMQMQQQLTAAEKEFVDQQLYPQRQMDWLSTQVRGMAPITPQRTLTSGSTTGATYNNSPLSQLASGFGVYKGLSSLDG
tara:strand:- start:3373 stop:4569 length:1197 start_codon:yes stop_codon:yes gene_type:complete